MKNSNQPAAGGRKFGGSFGAGKPGGKFGKPFGKPHGGAGRPFGKPGGNGDKPFGKPGGRPFGKPGMDRPFGNPGGDRPFGNAGSDRGFDKPVNDGEFGSRENEQTFGNNGARARAPFGDGGRPFGKPGGGRPYGKPGGGRPFGKPGEGRPFGKPGEGRPFGKPGEGRPFGNSGEGRPFGKPGGGRPFGKPGGRPFGGDGGRAPFGDGGRQSFGDGDRPSFGKRREAGDGEEGAFGSGVHAPRPRFGRDSFEGGRPSGKPGRFGAGRRGLRVDDGFDEPLARGDDDNEGSDERRDGGRVRKGMLDFDDLIYGIHSVEEALKAGEKLRTLHVGRGRNEDPLVARLVEVARELGVTIRVEDPSFFARIPYKAHQSVVAVGAPFDYVSLEDAINVRPAGNRLIVILDHLTDPHNVGAILRSAECAGAQAVLLPDRRSAGINATVRKTSAGATSHLPVAKVGNLSQVIRELKDEGFTVFGADMADDAVMYTNADFKGDVVLVIGGEGDGLARLVARSCDQIVKIPLSGTVASLNASVAAGILLYEVVRQRTQAV